MQANHRPLASIEPMPEAAFAEWLAEFLSGLATSFGRRGTE